jgi:hypothetical protein
VADPAPPAKKPAGPLRWILLGCGVLTCLGILGMGGCAGIFYFIYKGTDPVAEVGAAYLRQDPGVQKAIGMEEYSVVRDFTGWQVNVNNDKGNARISYTIRPPTAADSTVAVAVVWLLRDGGRWAPVGARVHPRGGDEITIGKPPKEHHRIDWDD